MTPKNLYLFGHGDLSKIVTNIVSLKNNINLCGYIEVLDNSYNYYSSNHELSENFDITSLMTDDNFFCIAVGHNYTRYKIHDFITKNFPTTNWLSIISDSADIKTDVLIGSGSIIHDNVYINSGTSIGNHCIINNNSSIDHDCIWSDFSSCGPVVITGGRVKIGNVSFIGMGSVILQGVNVSNNTVVGAKSLVNKNCNSNSMYYGTSAKFIKNISNDFNYLA